MQRYGRWVSTILGEKSKDPFQGIETVCPIDIFWLFADLCGLVFMGVRLLFLIVKI